jgi:hypothetical protein
MGLTDHSHAIIERLIRENPKLQFVSEDELKLADDQSKKYGFEFQVGPVNFAVHPDVLRLFPEYVHSDSRTIETGCGHTTIVLAALGKHHICVSPDRMGRELVEQYMSTVGIAKHKVTFIEGSSDTALSTLFLEEKIDFAYVDGCHGYPFPALDWHHIDKHLRIGGYIGFDDVEIPTVRQHCDFLDANRSYSLVKELISKGSGDHRVKIYRKEKDEPREWVFQAFTEKFLVKQAKARGAPGVIERTMAKVLPWRLVQAPLRKRFGWPRSE